MGDLPGEASAAQLPDETVEAATRLTRRARRARTDAEAERHRERRAELLDDHGYAARVREEDASEVLVLYPREWLADGTVRTERIDDLDRAVEVRLSGPADPDDWDAVDEHNRQRVEEIGAEHGEDHAANVDVFADFMGNHYAKRLDEATPGEVAEFLEEYYPRNAWPSDRQRELVEESVALVTDVPVDGDEGIDGRDDDQGCGDGQKRDRG